MGTPHISHEAGFLPPSAFTQLSALVYIQTTVDTRAPVPILLSLPKQLLFLVQQVCTLR